LGRLIKTEAMPKNMSTRTARHRRDGLAGGPFHGIPAKPRQHTLKVVGRAACEPNGRWSRRGIGAALLLGVAALVGACDVLGTEAPDDADLLDAPLEGLTPEQQAAFARGDAEFGRAFAASSGLGPLFNDVSCAACHSGDGRGTPANVLLRYGSAGDGHGGPQLQTRAIAGARAEELPAGMPWSPRLPPPVFGVGLIEAIPESAILALADPTDADGDGISGRAHLTVAQSYVPTSEVGGGPGLHVGRFGRKAQVTSLVEQTVEAYHQDMGVTSPFRPSDNVDARIDPVSAAADRVLDPEIPASTVQAVVSYLRLLAPPAPGGETPERTRGAAVFSEIGCAACHTPELHTGPSTISAIANRPVALYSDLLLHDMGDELADGRPDGAADGREWRTPPLWGLRVARDFLAGALYLMHDGRAGTIEEAIELHGGEGAAARARFRALSAQDRSALVDFVSSR
jgi:CxxC motif-containing protein (DUF1111 family)